MKIRKGNVIRSVDDWFTEAPPKRGRLQWADGRSAKELAKAWFPSPGDPQVPAELRAMLDSHDATRDAVLDVGEPERLTHFDDCGGEPRNADLVLWGRLADGGKLVVSVEAKADESFGDIAGRYVRESSKRNPRSRVPQRFGLLCRGVLGVSPEDPDALALRYQLLTAVAGLLADAADCGADTALFIVHEFVGLTDDEKLATNSADLDRFIRLLSHGEVETLPPGTLAGPFAAPGNEHFSGTNRLFVGKCRRAV